MCIIAVMCVYKMNKTLRCAVLGNKVVTGWWLSFLLLILFLTPQHDDCLVLISDQPESRITAQFRLHCTPSLKSQRRHSRPASSWATDTDVRTISLNGMELKCPLYRSSNKKRACCGLSTAKASNKEMSFTQAHNLLLSLAFFLPPSHTRSSFHGNLPSWLNTFFSGRTATRCLESEINRDHRRFGKTSEEMLILRNAFSNTVSWKDALFQGYTSN